MSEIPLTKTYTSSQVIKFIQCLFVSVAIWDFYNSMVFYPLIIKYRHAPAMLAPLESLNLVLTLSGVLFAIIYPIYWHRKEKIQEYRDSLPICNLLAQKVTYL